MKCPHCGKEIEDKPAEIVWMRINGKSQSIEKTANLPRDTPYYYKNRVRYTKSTKTGPRLIYVKDKP
jgi:hypothetical protein